MRVEPLTQPHSRHVFARLRASDVAEVWALLADDPSEDSRRSRADAWAEAAACGAYGEAALCDDGEAAALFLAVPTSPVCVTIGFVATDRWPEIGRAYTRRMLKDVAPMLESSGVRRMEARIMGENDDAIAWADALGARPEVVLEGYGKNGEWFIQVARTAC